MSQQQIASELGVSQALVSLALNGRREGIHSDTYRRIWEHALSRGYQPRGMRLDQSPTAARPRQVGILLRSGLALHNQGTYFSLVLQGVHSALAERGYRAVLLGSEDELDAPRLEQAFAPPRTLDGLVLLGEVAPDFLTQLRRHERRIVAVSARHPGRCHSVIGNEAQALDLLIDHLVGLGHRRLGWLGGNVGLARHQMRYEAFREGLRRRELPCVDEHVVRLEQGDRAEGVEAIDRLLALHPASTLPTAFIAYNTLMAAGAVRALVRHGWAVPGKFSVAGADSSRLAVAEEPTITVAGCDAERLGAAAARILLESTGDEEESFIDLILPARLSIGQTTGPVVV